MPANLLTDATSFIPPAVASLAARTTMEVMGRTRPPVNLVISNVPGPRSPLFLAGAKLEANYPVSVVVDGVGLNITVMSYLDHLDFGIVADRDQVDDVWTLLDRLVRRARRAHRGRARQGRQAARTTGQRQDRGLKVRQRLGRATAGGAGAADSGAATGAGASTARCSPAGGRSLTSAAPTTAS